MKKNEKGVTLVALAITITILIIIVGISVSSGKEIIKKAQLEELRTNMLLIQAKAREYVEEVNFKIGFSTDEETKTNARAEVYEGKGKLEKSTGATGIPQTETLYKVTSQTLQEWGLSKIQLKSGEEYLINFDDANVKVEVYNTIGYNDNGTTKYSLTDIEAIED